MVLPSEFYPYYLGIYAVVDITWPGDGPRHIVTAKQCDVTIMSLIGEA
jgi:hypothetical protein